MASAPVDEVEDEPLTNEEALANLGGGGINKLPGNLLDFLECAEVMPNLKEKELLELDGKNLQIRQVGVNGDPPDPILISWSPKSGFSLIEPWTFWKAEKSLLNPMMGFGSDHSFLGLESPSKIGLLGSNVAMTQGFLAHQESYPSKSPRNSHYKLRYRFFSKGNRTRHV
ncbi:hypothetical protein DY000_02021513 [Brassica cretica]|uniref:Uncharacterized protein n=1 Tax=Brassica cretica TaxID=69181 RepID=A0ABQ7E456_BRACR|nr:hypothetical protein DY000_02021513 [Brassica cretica]